MFAQIVKIQIHKEPSHQDLDYLTIRAQLLKTNDVVSKRIIKFLIIKYGRYAKTFAEKM